MLFKKKVTQVSEPSISEEQKSYLSAQLKELGAEKEDIDTFLSVEESYEAKLIKVLEETKDLVKEQRENIAKLSEEITSPVGNLETEAIVESKEPKTMDEAIEMVEKNYKIKGRDAVEKACNLYPTFWEVKI